MSGGETRIRGRRNDRGTITFRAVQREMQFHLLPLILLLSLSRVLFCNVQHNSQSIDPDGYFRG